VRADGAPRAGPTGRAAARKHVFADAAHMVNMEYPDEFNRVVLEFLAAHPLLEVRS